MAYNNGREDRKWRIWKEAEEKVLREHGVDEATIEQIRIDDRADFNSNRRFYHWTSDFGEYLEGMADREQSAEVKTVEDLLDEIEDENLYQALLTVDRRTLQIVLLKMKDNVAFPFGQSVKGFGKQFIFDEYIKAGHLKTEIIAFVFVRCEKLREFAFAQIRKSNFACCAFRKSAAVAFRFADQSFLC